MDDRYLIKKMTKGEYNAYRGWVVPAGEIRRNDKGFLLIHDGKKSWVSNDNVGDLLLAHAKGE